MSEHREDYEDDLTAYSVDDEDQLQPEDSLDDRGIEDVLDEGYSPPERAREMFAFGTTAAEQRQGESIDQRVRQEVPDPNLAFDDPLDDDDERVGGDDPDAIDALDDWLGDGEVGDERSGRLVAPDQGTAEDLEKDMIASDVGIDGAGASAEEAAMHVVREE